MSPMTTFFYQLPDGYSWHEGTEYMGPNDELPVYRASFYYPISGFNRSHPIP